LKASKPVCPYDGCPCYSRDRGCFAQTFGVLGDDVVWACRRFPRGQLDSEPLEWVDFE
jgi:hypothetical protein